MQPFEKSKWREKFKEKEILLENLPDHLHKLIHPGTHICIGSACSEPVVLTNHLTTKKYRWNDCSIWHFFTLSNQKFFSEKFPTRFRHNTLSIIGTRKMRDAINRGKADFIPLNASEIPHFLRQHKIAVDVCFLQVSPPDKNGFLSLGINVDVNRAIVDSAKTVIVQINPKMPRTLGDSFIRFRDIDHFVYYENNLLEYNPPEIDKTSEKVAEKVASYTSKLIENGSTLNLGIGKIPYILPKFLQNKKNLALYSEVLLESVVPLIESEVIDCSKNYYPHNITSFILGTRKFYDFVDNNPFIEFHPTEYISNIENISKNYKLCSIYGALTVDLFGQTTNHLGTSLYGGVGGEADFMRGSALSKGGKSIIALPSITRDGKSRIVTSLPPGPVTLRNIDVHYVVTEWGIAYLHGKSVRERTMQMISVAHPKFRHELLEEAKKLRFIYEDQKIPSSKDGIAVIRPDIVWWLPTKDKGKIYFSPVKQTDERMLQDLYYSLSERDRIMRFLNPQQYFTHKETQSRILCNFQTCFVIVGIVGKETSQRIIAVGAYYLEPNTNLVEFSVTIHETYRKQGLGRQILNKIIEMAYERGYSGLCGDVHQNNRAMLHILNTSPYEVIFSKPDDTEVLNFHFYFDSRKDYI
ncbi:MAG: GNAT family N-acetyltransferase [Promethearchaeota archaeon]